MKCLLCHQIIIDNPSLFELFINLRPIGKSVCEFCFSKFEPIRKKSCRYCGKTTDKNVCEDCQYWKKYFHSFVKHTALYQYNQAMHDYFRSYKRKGDYQLAEVFASEIRYTKYFKKFDLITYIPSTAEHLETRKFNPVQVLFHQLPLQNVLEVIHDTGPQAQKNRLQRLQTPQKFAVTKNLDRYRRILIVDDIYTTGRTLNLARSAILQQNQNCQIETFSLAR